MGSEIGMGWDYTPSRKDLSFEELNFDDQCVKIRDHIDTFLSPFRLGREVCKVDSDECYDVMTKWSIDAKVHLQLARANGDDPASSLKFRSLLDSLSRAWQFVLARDLLPSEKVDELLKVVADFNEKGLLKQDVLDACVNWKERLMKSE